MSRKRARRHGFARGAGHNPRRHVLYARWVNIRQRCTNPNHPRWEDYGGRKTALCPDGIYVAARWSDFRLFVQDVGLPPHGRLDLYSLDRIDNDGPYTPENVRWATHALQRANQYRAPWPFGVLDQYKDQYSGDWRNPGEEDEVARQWLEEHGEDIRGAAD